MKFRSTEPSPDHIEMAGFKESLEDRYYAKLLNTLRSINQLFPDFYKAVSKEIEANRIVMEKFSGFTSYQGLF